MINNLLSRNTITIIGVLFIILAGCGTTEPSRFYLLSPGQFPDSAVKDINESLTLGIGPVDLPEYLDRPQIVTMKDPNSLVISDFDRWAEPLKHNITRVLADDLSTLLVTDQIFFFPWRGSAPVDYQITVDVIRFEKGNDGRVTLSARWSISNGYDNKMQLMKKSTIMKPVEEEIGYDALVGVMSEALTDLGSEIAAAIKDIRR